MPASSEVEFGETTDYTYVVGRPDAHTTEHSVLVVGMKPNRTYHMQAVSRTPDGKESRSGDRVFETGPLPFEDFAAELRVDEATLRRPGWTLASLKSSDARLGINAVLFDGDGDIVWYFHETGHGEGWAMESHVVDNGHVTLGGAHPTGYAPVEVNRGGDVVWKGPVQPDAATPGAMHHTFRQLDDGTYASLIFGFEDGHLFDEIWEFDRGGETTWQWSSRDHLFDGEDDTGKWCNAIDHDLEAGVVYLNCNRDGGNGTGTDICLWVGGNNRIECIGGGTADKFYVVAESSEPWAYGHKGGNDFCCTPDDLGGSSGVNVYISMDSGADTACLTDHDADVIYTFNGDDDISGGNGGDTIRAGKGADTVYGGLGKK